MEITLLGIEKRGRHWNFWNVDDYIAWVRVKTAHRSKIKRFSLFLGSSGLEAETYLSMHYILNKARSKNQFGPMAHELLKQAFATESKVQSKSTADDVEIIIRATKQTITDLIDRTFIFPDVCPTCNKPFP